VSRGSSSGSRLENLLGYRFRDKSLLQRALTHPSHPEGNNERLEFLGDAVLNLAVAEELYRKHPGEREGSLTTWKSLLVSRRTLGRVAARLDLGAFLRTGPSLEMRASLPRSILGNTLEALIGAVFLDGGFEAAAGATLLCLASELAGVGEAHEKTLAKQVLQLFAQKELGTLPRYRVLEQFDHPETTAFQVRVELGSRTFPPAWGTTKKDAERRAAWEAILVLREEGNLAG